MITIAIPWPPSVNSYWRSVNGRTLISKRGRLYKEAVRRCVLRDRADKHLAGKLAVKVILHPPDRRRRDIDNTAKAMLDSLQAAGVFLDDSQIDKLLLERAECEKGGVALVTIAEIKPPRKS